MEVIDKNEYISKIEVVRILQKAYAEGRIKAKDGLSSVLDDIQKADVQPVKKCKMIPQKTDCRGYTDVFLCTNCQLHIHLGFISKNYGGNFCLECGAEVEDGEQND